MTKNTTDDLCEFAPFIWSLPLSVSTFSAYLRSFFFISKFEIQVEVAFFYIPLIVKSLLKMYRNMLLYGYNCWKKTFELYFRCEIFKIHSKSKSSFVQSLSKLILVQKPVVDVDIGTIPKLNLKCN